MRYRDLTEEEKKDPKNSVTYWREQIKEHGSEHVRQLLSSPLPVSAMWQIFARKALEEYDKDKQEQRDREIERRETREDEAHEILKNSHRREGDRSYEQVQLGKWQVFFAFLSIVVMIWLAFAFS